jgi:hypothetical protein
MDEEKLQWLKNNGYVKFDKDEAYRDVLKCNAMPAEYINDWLSKYKYYRRMLGGRRMYYSEAYLRSHTITELNRLWRALNYEQPIAGLQ